MRTLTRSEVKSMLKDHADWLTNSETGKRADFSECDLREHAEDLRYANLRYANLRYADLSSADLSSANLRYANLRYADLSSADLSSANLRYANLRYANLRSANLSYANLRSANLRSADLRYADLSYADLSSADLSSANLSSAKEDFLHRLNAAKSEAAGLYDYLQKGLIDGSSYTDECCCFVGTIAKIRGEDHDHMTIDLKPDSSSPTEVWFMGISKGDTPASNQISRITGEWIEEFAKSNEIELPKYKIVSSVQAPTAFN